MKISIKSIDRTTFSRFKILTAVSFAAWLPAVFAQTLSCTPLVAAATANSPGLDQRLRENAQQFDTDFLRERIARAKLTAGQDSARALAVCIFEQELALRSGRSTTAASPAAAPLRDDPKVFGRSARGG
jgi:hypothetical protein